jgi:tol-pal system protein YbgF
MTASRFALSVPYRALIVAVALAAAAAPAQALFGDDEARKAILDLRAKVAEQDKQLRDKDAELAARLDRIEAASRAQLEFANTIDALRREIAQLRGQVETLANDVSVVQKRSRDLYADVDTRIRQLEPTAITLEGRQVTVERSEQAAWDAALAQFRSGDYRGASTALQNFVARYPNSPYVPAAYYWLGNAHYAQKDYKAAIAAQQVVVERYADSPRTPDALLLIAASQTELKDTKAARTTLQKVMADFPQSEAARLADDRLKLLPAERDPKKR